MLSKLNFKIFKTYVKYASDEGPDEQMGSTSYPWRSDLDPLTYTSLSLYLSD